MIVDTSALIAILRQEEDAARFAAALESTSASRVSAATLVETGVVAGQARTEDLRELVRSGAIETIPFDAEHCRAALDGHRRFGKGSGSPARLNLGDCFSYALAKVTGEPLLFKGDDFRHTDVEPAL
jgi:ribonuclease VapC